jgi:hypothetical protein
MASRAGFAKASLFRRAPTIAISTPFFSGAEGKLSQLGEQQIAPSDGYALVVDGHFKAQFAEEGAAKKAAVELLAKYPMRQVEIYDASSKSRTLVK